MSTERELVQRLGVVGRSFFGGFDSLREVQRQAIEPIHLGGSVLVSSATASGKTEAVLAPLIARIREQSPGQVEGVRLLAVAPTRALVNDLYARLEAPLAACGWRAGRQTSDHQDKTRSPHVLITTPESFDSMLVRDGRWEHGVLCGHLLSTVEAVFIDEAHLFESSPRGAQLVWLLGRLRRLRAHGVRTGGQPSEAIQACGASGSGTEPARLPERLLGPGSLAIVVPGSREIDLLGVTDQTTWVRLDQLPDLEAIHSALLYTGGADDIPAIVAHVWRAIERGSETDCRKVLVFVPSRALCDRLALKLADALKGRRELFVGAHHGSLERPARERAESEFARNRDAVLVATTTLEVGIDIGDVDVVAVVGAPPDTSSLLQRIGRSGRRTGRVRILPIVRGQVEGRAMASMLEAACHGVLDPVPHARLWSVFVQQAASHTAQARRPGRRRSDLLGLAQSVWPETTQPGTATQIIDGLVDGGVLKQVGDRLVLGDEWSDRFERAGGDFHHNFGSGGQGVPVIDSATGEVIAHVPQQTAGGGSVAIGGRRWRVVSQSGEIVVSTAAKASGDAPFQYATRAAPIGRPYASHLRRGLGFGETSAPVVRAPNGELWFHFGGAVTEAVLKQCLSGLRSVRGLVGIALSGRPTAGEVEAIARDPEPLARALHALSDELAMPSELGRHHDLLPAAVQRDVCRSMCDLVDLQQWLVSRTLEVSESEAKALFNLVSAMGWPDEYAVRSRYVS